MSRFALPLILLTAFLDILSLGVLIPVLPEIVSAYGMTGSWVGYSQGLFATGMFLGGIIFGRMSDRIGRRNTLILTSTLNLAGYLAVAFEPEKIASVFGGFVLAPLIVFLIGRSIGGFGSAGFGVVQAYISDISSPEERTRRLGLIGAMFGLGFIAGPAFGGVLAPLIGIHGVAWSGIVFGLINIALILFLLPEPTVHQHQESTGTVSIRAFFAFLVISLVGGFAFAPMQAMGSQFWSDEFGFSPQQIGFWLAYVGISAFIYQAFLMKYVRKYLDERAMIVLGASILAVTFILFGLNRNVLAMYFLVPWFPVAFGSIQPALSAYLANRAGRKTGEVLWWNQSAMSLGGALGPVVAGFLYSIAHGLPYYVAGICFAFLAVYSFVIMTRAKV